MKWLVIAMLYGSSASPPARDNFGEAFPKWVPTDVRRFVIDAQACAHFSGEYPYDAERKAFLDKMIRETCTGLDERKAELDRRYGGSAEIRRMIAQAWGQ